MPRFLASAWMAANSGGSFTTACQKASTPRMMAFTSPSWSLQTVQGGVMNSEPLRIVHITDTHIVAEPGAEVYGVDSFAALESLLAVMQRDPWTPHLLIATGDLSEDGSAVSYQRLRSLLTPLGLPVYCIPGNHDVLAEMHTHLQGGPIHLARRVVWEPWQIVLLDSQVPGQGHGYLSHRELTALEEALQEAPGYHTLVCLHHGPLPVCPMPPCRLENAEEFLALLERYPQ